jgi:hypothetical protein
VAIVRSLLAGVAMRAGAFVVVGAVAIAAEG